MSTLADLMNADTTTCAECGDPNACSCCALCDDCQMLFDPEAVKA